jgi:hypothetical protein
LRDLQGFAYFFSNISTRNLQLLSRGSLVRVQHGSLLINQLHPSLQRSRFKARDRKNAIQSKNAVDAWVPLIG